jgi:GDP-4-dehydro-6-deoxy-D-mannose reductase
MRCVVTGGAGFAGRHLVHELERHGHTVHVLDRSHVDVSDLERVAETFTALRPEAVFHLAAISHVGDSWNDPGAVERVNVGGTRAVVEASAAHGTDVVVVVGSAEEYGAIGSIDTPILESSEPAPRSPYGVSKLAATRFAISFATRSPMRVVVVRPFNHTGPGQTTRFMVPALAHRILAAQQRGENEIAVGNLDPVRDLGDVRDVVRAYRLAAEHGTSGEIYNVATGRGVTVRSIALRLMELTGADLTMRVDTDLARPVDVPVLIGDATKFRDATGWRPEIDLDTTLADVVADARLG